MSGFISEIPENSVVRCILKYINFYNSKAIVRLEVSLFKYELKIILHI